MAELQKHAPDAHRVSPQACTKQDEGTEAAELIVSPSTVGVDPGQAPRRARQGTLDNGLSPQAVVLSCDTTRANTPRRDTLAGSLWAASVSTSAPQDAVVLDMSNAPLIAGKNTQQTELPQVVYSAADPPVCTESGPGTRSAPAGVHEACALISSSTSGAHSGAGSMTPVYLPNTSSALLHIESRGNLATKELPVVPAAVGAPIQTHDGVFSNLAARPEVMVLPKAEDDEPPPYDDPVHLNSNLYPGAQDAAHSTRVFSGGETGLFDEVMIDDYEVGSYLAFSVYFLVSSLFEWLGAAMALALSQCHAARYGSISGLGLTIALQSPRFYDYATKDVWWKAHEPLINVGTFILAFGGYVMLLFGLFAYHRYRLEAKEYLEGRSGSTPPTEQHESAPVGSFFGIVHDNPYA